MLSRDSSGKSLNNPKKPQFIGGEPGYFCGSIVPRKTWVQLPASIRIPGKKTTFVFARIGVAAWEYCAFCLFLLMCMLLRMRAALRCCSSCSCTLPWQKMPSNSNALLGKHPQDISPNFDFRTFASKHRFSRLWCSKQCVGKVARHLPKNPPCCFWCVLGRS